MSRILSDLLKHASHKHIPREDFTTTCLAELMRRDRLTAHVVLEVLGLTEHADRDLTYRTVHTQVRLKGSKKRADLSVWIGLGAASKRLLIEAKVWSPPDPAQIRVYSKLAGCPVALLAPQKRLPRHDDPDWDGIPRGSWEAIAERLRDANARLDSNQIPAFRVDFLALLDELGISGLRHLSPAEFRAASQAKGRFPEWVSLVAQGVSALLPKGKTPAQHWETNTENLTDEPKWGSTQPLDAYWSAVSAPHGGLLGLELSGWAVGTRSAPALSWTLSVKPSPEITKKYRNKLEQGGVWNFEGDWWWVYLADQLDPDRALSACLRDAVLEARAVLQDELSIEAEVLDADVALNGSGDVPLRTVHAELEVQQRATKALETAIRAIIDQLFQGLAQRLDSKARMRATREPRIELLRDGGNSVFIGAKSWLSGRPGLIVWTAWGGEKRNATLTHLFIQGEWGDVDAHPGPNTGNLDLVLHVDQTPLVHSTINTLVDGWLARFDQHRDLVMAPGRNAE